METARPKIGLLPLTAEWFISIGASQGAFGALPGLLAGDAAAVEALLAPEVDVVNPGVLATPAEVAAAMARFRREGVDAVVACPLTWAEDALLLAAVEALGELPLLLWCFTPAARLPETLTMTDLFRGSGPVAALQYSAPLKRLGARFATAVGSPASPAAGQVIAFARAARAARRLRGARIGVLPHRCEVMTGTWVDEFRLRRELGAELRYIDSHEYEQLCRAIPDARVEAFIAGLTAAHPVAPSVTAEGLRRSARASLGLAEVAERYALDAVAIEDIGEAIHRALGVRPCLCVPALFERAVVSMEAEVGGAVALLLLRALTGLPVLYAEIFAADEAENAVLAGHAGMMDARLAAHPEDVLLEPDGEYAESEPDSCWMRFRVRGGRVTLLSVFCDVERFKLVVATGEAVGGPPKLLGSPHAWIRLDTPLPDFFTACLRTGMTQHWAVAHADVTAELAALAAMRGLEYVRV